ncbi:DUF3916 domain-containing protein [Anoxybacteroides tepidamans]|uniref:DUF3916 domain-containing protein n=1 Tax=Anoxybacteroides tepidamans TaxID=265948 RepID=UPI000484CB04|nr:DUF3916 domain-containing protein [Anoxybacillus tepidamans]
MRDKKLRGLKRKIRNMIQRIEQETAMFPMDFYNGYWHFHVPVAQNFISSSKTPYGIKQLCIQTLLARAEHLIKIRPDTSEKARVVVAITLPDLSGSQMIVFYGDSHFEGFFDRNDEFQKWSPLSKERNFEREWGINIPDNMSVLGFKEQINDGDGDIFEQEIWFMGELD